MSLNKILRHFLILPFTLSRSKTKIIFEICPGTYSCEQKRRHRISNTVFVLSSNQDPEGLKGKIITCLLTTYFIKVHSFKVGTIHTLFFRSTLVVMHIMLVACLAALVVGSSHLGLHPQSIFICIFFFSFFFFLFFFSSF